MNKNWKIETQAIQGGYDPKPGDPRVVTICQSTTFKYDSADYVAKLFDLEVAGHFYTRLGNPTTDAFEKKIAMMEGGVAALGTSSGQAATTLSIFNICQAGQHFITASTLYGGTYNLFASTLPKMGIEVTFIDPEASADEILKAFRPNTRALFAETIGNPGLNVESGLERLIRKAYELLGLITYFTAGVKEVRAWTVILGSKAPQAAGVIHSDFEKGFIRAEVIAFNDFVTCGGESGAKEKGLLRLEGKEYLVQDGDVMHFRFNV